MQGASATNSGLLLLPLLGAMLVTSMVAGRVTTNTGRYKIFPVVGGALMTVGLYLLSLMDTDTSRLTSGVYMAVVGLGMGCLMQITMLVAQNSVEMKDMGVASSSTTLFRTLGSSFGVAIMGALFNHRVQDVMAEKAGALGSEVTEQSAQLDAASLAKLPEAARDAYQHAVSAGSHGAFLLGAAVAVLALVAAVFVKGGPAEGRGPEGGGRPGRRGRRHGGGEGTGDRGGVSARAACAEAPGWFRPPGGLRRTPVSRGRTRTTPSCPARRRTP